MISRKSLKHNKHYRKSSKKVNFNELISNFIEYFNNKTVSKSRRRKRHRTKSISKEIAAAAQDNQDDFKSKKTLLEFQKEKSVKPIYLDDEKKKESINEILKLVDEKDNMDIIREKFANVKNSKDNIRSQNIDDIELNNDDIELNNIERLSLEEEEILKKIKSSNVKPSRALNAKREPKKEVINAAIHHHNVKVKRGSKLKYKNINFDLRTKSLILMCLCGSGFVLFYLIPFIFSIYYSLINNAFDKKFVWLSNYIEVMQNHYFKLALKNTFQFTFIAVGILIPISFILSVIIVNLSKSMDFVKPAFFIPMLLPTASVIIIWKILFGDYSYIYAFLNNNTGRIPIYLLFLWKNCGYNIILFSAAFLSVDKYIYEAASLDGVNTFQKHLFITFPLILPTVFFIFIISLVNSFKIFKEVYLFYGTSYPEQNLYLVQHYMKNHFDKLNYQNLTTGAIIFAIIVYIIVAIGYKIQAKVASEAWY